MFFGILVLVVGVVWLLNGLGVVSTDIWQIILPTAVILADFAMMGKHCNCGKCWFCQKRIMRNSRSCPGCPNCPMCKKCPMYNNEDKSK